MYSDSFHIPFWRGAAGDLAEDEQHLLRRAADAARRAHAPYSGFRVGCALLLSNGEIIEGNNQENRAYPSGLCAERTALFYAGSQEKAGLIVKIAIRTFSGYKTLTEAVMPCGACRQVMVEYERECGGNFIVLSQAESGEVLRVEGVRRSLMPFDFDTDFLDRS